MDNFDFKSQPCTSREQSERLLALGLKKETSDMVYAPHYVNGVLKDYFEPKILKKKVLEYMLTDEAFKDYIPAWSLHRLIELAYGNWKEEIVPIYLGNSYDMLIGRIEFQVKQGKFNKEYLV